jgi:hypothetical protein
VRLTRLKLINDQGLTEASPAQSWPAERIEQWSIEQLIPYANNARLHSETDIDELADSLRRWGWTNPVVAGDWDGAERSAAALEDFTGSEPLPFSDFYIARARALAAGGGDRSDAAALAVKLERLREEGERLGLRVALPAIEMAIKEMRG